MALFLAAASHCSRLWADSSGVVGRTSAISKTCCGYPIFKFFFHLPKWFAEYFQPRRGDTLDSYFFQFYWASIRNLWRLKDSGRWRFSEDNISFSGATSDGPPNHLRYPFHWGFTQWSFGVPLLWMIHKDYIYI